MGYGSSDGGGGGEVMGLVRREMEDRIREGIVSSKSDYCPKVLL